MHRSTCRPSLFVCAAVAVAITTAADRAHADEVTDVETMHRASIATRRTLADVVLVEGLGSIALGGGLIASDAEDQAFRYAGINTAVFGVVNTIVSLVALHGIAKEEERWESSEAAAARRSPNGLARARIAAAEDEHREGTSHAINLGLSAAYLAVGGTAILASQLGVDHPNRWLGSGIAVGAQALFLVAIDYVGLSRASHYHLAFIVGLAPSVVIVPTARGTDTFLGLGATFSASVARDAAALTSGDTPGDPASRRRRCPCRSPSLFPSPATSWSLRSSRGRPPTRRRAPRRARRSWASGASA
jgi:hypothetical protein